MIMVYAQPPFSIPNEEPAKQGFFFIENGGQIIDSDGNPDTEVLFYSIFGNERIYIRPTGISIVTANKGQDATSNDTIQRVDLEFAGSNPAIYNYQTSHLRTGNVHTLEQTSGRFNFFLGHIPEGITNVPAFKRIVFEDVFQDIDIGFFSNPEGFKLYFVIHPGGDPNLILLNCDGQDNIGITQNKELHLETQPKKLKFDKLHAFQINPANQIVPQPVKFVQNANQISCSIPGSLNPNFTTVIVMDRGHGKDVGQTRACNDWSTYLGGNGLDQGNAVTADSDGNVYFIGQTRSDPFPVSTGGTIQPAFAGGEFDAYVGKFDQDGVPIWMTYYGGSLRDVAQGIDLNSNGDIYIVGTTSSDDFPLEPAGNTVLNGSADAFFLRLNNAGDSKLFARYFGGDNNDEGRSVAIDGNENVYFVGTTKSTSQFPTQPKTSAYNQNNYGGGSEDGYIAEFDAANNQVWGTYFGGFDHDNIADVKVGVNNEIYVSGSTLSDVPASDNTANTPCDVPAIGDFPDCDPGGGAYFQGWGGTPLAFLNHDAFLAEFDQNGAMQWSTYLGGFGHEGSNFFKNNIVLDPNDPTILYLVGTSGMSDNFPIQGPSGSYIQTKPSGGGVPHVYITKFNNRVIEWGTLFGTGAGNATNGISATMDNDQNLYITGHTQASIPTTTSDYCCVPPPGEFPICPCTGMYFQENGSGNPEFGGGVQDAFLAAFNSSNKLIWSTYFGGNKNDESFSVAYNAVNNKIYFTGRTQSLSKFPVLDPGTSGTYVQTSNGGGTNDLDAFVAGLCIEICSGSPCGATGLGETANVNNNQFLIYPNPANDKIYFDFQEANKSRFDLAIINALGQLIYAERNLSSEKAITIKELPKGIYSVQLISGEVTKIAKFIVQ